MSTKYTKYSEKRKSINAKIAQLKKAGYSIPEGYELPTVKELKTYPNYFQSQIMRKASLIKTSSIASKSYKEEWAKNRKGKTVKKKIYYKPSQKKSIDAQKVEKPKKTKAEILQEWGKEFVKSAPVNDRKNAKMYVDAVISGDIDLEKTGYEDWKASLPSEPNVRQIFNDKIEALNNIAPETADFLQSMYKKYSGAEGIDNFWDRLNESEGEIPDFDEPYDGKEISGGRVIKMAFLLKGRALSGGEWRRLSQALEADQG